MPSFTCTICSKKNKWPVIGFRDKHLVGLICSPKCLSTDTTITACSILAGSFTIGDTNRFAKIYMFVKHGIPEYVSQYDMDVKYFEKYSKENKQVASDIAEILNNGIMSEMINDTFDVFLEAEDMGKDSEESMSNK